MGCGGSRIRRRRPVERLDVIPQVEVRSGDEVGVLLEEKERWGSREISGVSVRKARIKRVHIDFGECYIFLVIQLKNAK